MRKTGRPRQLRAAHLLRQAHDTGPKTTIGVGKRSGKREKSSFVEVMSADGGESGICPAWATKSVIPSEAKESLSADNNRPLRQRPSLPFQEFGALLNWSVFGDIRPRTWRDDEAVSRAARMERNAKGTKAVRFILSRSAQV